MAFQRQVNFRPGRNTPITASATQTVVAFLSIAQDYRITNISGQTVHIAVGSDATVAATTNDMPIPTATVQLLRRDPDRDTHISVRTATGTGTVHLTEGEGGA